MELFCNHFQIYGNTENHICFRTFKRLFEEIEAKGCPPLTIIETGTANTGTKSTYLFDAYVNKYGGIFWSVDICERTCLEAKNNTGQNTHIICSDSIEFLETWVRDHPGKQIDIVYLDSFDLDWNDPFPSGNHGFKEYNAILPALQKGSLLLIDDTPKTTDELLEAEHQIFLRAKRAEKIFNFSCIGKGMYILDCCKAELLEHFYQILYKF